MPSRYFRFLTTALGITMVLASCGGSGAKVATGCSGSGNIVIGVIAPSSGAAREIVGSFAVGAQQAVADVNAKGGVCGRNLSIVVKDNGSDSTQDAGLAQALVDQDHAVGVILISDQDLQSAGAFLQSKGVLTVCACTGDDVDSGPKAKDTFSVATPNQIEKALWSKYLFGIKHVKQPAALYETTSSFGVTQSTSFCQAAQSNGTPCVAKEQTTIETTDVTDQVGDMVRHGADSVFLEGFGNPVVQTITKSRAAGITGPILGTATVATSTNLVNALVTPADRQGYVYINYRTATQGDPQAAISFATELRKNGPILDPLFIPMFSHDAVELMVQGWRGAKSLNGDDASRFIETLNYKVGDGTFTLHDAVYSPQHHEPQLTGWLTLCTADALDANGLAVVAPDAAALLG